YGFFIATLLFLGKRKLLSAYQGFERRVATSYDLSDIPHFRCAHLMKSRVCICCGATPSSAGWNVSRGIPRSVPNSKHDEPRAIVDRRGNLLHRCFHG